MRQIKLSKKQIQTKLEKLNGWSLKGGQIRKTVEAEDFVRAMGFVNSVALLAERQNHHPDINIRWNKVTLVLSTHSAGGLTSGDFTLAARIDEI